MEEDILTKRQLAIGSHRYSYCNSCGCAIPRRKAILIPAESLGQARSEQGELCAECAAELSKGNLIITEE
jgi:RNA polymerase-binding transcription factor DksA